MDEVSDLFISTVLGFVIGTSLLGTAIVAVRFYEEDTCEAKHNVHDCVRVEYWVPAKPEVK